MQSGNSERARVARLATGRTRPASASLQRRWHSYLYLSILVLISGVWGAPAALGQRGAGVGDDRPAMSDSAGARPPRPEPDGDRPATPNGPAPDSVRVHVDPDPERLPWPRILPPPALGSPIELVELDRDEVERAGARTPFQVLELVPGFATLEVASIADIGALATGGSFGGARFVADGWEVRNPRLEGRDLSAMLLDRLSPHAGYANFASIGSFSMSTAFADGSATGTTVRFNTLERPRAEGPRSRVVVHTAGFGFTGGGVTLVDQRSGFAYRIGVMNASAGQSGAITVLNTRLASIDVDWRALGWRMYVSSRNGERDSRWKFDQGLNLDNQEFRFVATRGDSIDPAWTVQTSYFDERLNGDAVGAEFQRKGLAAGAEWRPYASRPIWIGGSVERDWLALVSPSQTFAPRVERARGHAGLSRAIGPSVIEFDATVLFSATHGPRVGGRAELRRPLGRSVLASLIAERQYRRPTLDQESLSVGGAPAVPERSDAGTVKIEGGGRVVWSAALTRRHLGDVPVIAAELGGKPWPRYRFRALESGHWNSRIGAMSVPLGSLVVRLGAHLDHLAIDDDPRFAPPLVPELTAVASVSAELSFFGGDLVVRPRFVAHVVGERHDFDGGVLPSYTRLDGSLMVIMLESADLELSFRNMTGERYPLGVIDPTTGRFYTDSGRNLGAGLRWRLFD